MYQANPTRYDKMVYRRCGKSGIDLSVLSLGFWHNFGGYNVFENSRTMVRTAFDHGICSFDLANNYGPPAGSAEETFGQIMKKDFLPYRDEMFISSKAGWGMWPGPYGDFGSKKYLIASLDQSLKRMGLDYVDVFYHHRPDPKTPMEETADALAQIIREGKALYAGISSYNPEDTRKMYALLKERGVKLFIHQPSYSMMNRTPEGGLLDTLDELGVGSIVFCPLYQGILTDRYLNGIPADSRAARVKGYLAENAMNEKVLEKVRKLAVIASERGQTMPQLALAWVLRKGRVTSAIIGASRPEQIIDNLGAINNMEFSEEELNRIDTILAE